MHFRHLSMLKFHIATAMLLSACGCHCCSLGQNRANCEQAAFEADELKCPTNLYGDPLQKEKQRACSKSRETSVTQTSLNQKEIKSTSLASTKDSARQRESVESWDVSLVPPSPSKICEVAAETFIPPSPLIDESVIASSESHAGQDSEPEMQTVCAECSEEIPSLVAIIDLDSPLTESESTEEESDERASEDPSRDVEFKKVLQTDEELATDHEANSTSDEAVRPVSKSIQLAPAKIRVPERQQSAQSFGVVQSVNLKNDTAQIRLPTNCQPLENSRVHIVHKFALGRVQSIGEFEVTASAPGIATVRPIARSSLRMISVGDSARVF